MNALLLLTITIYQAEAKPEVLGVGCAPPTNMAWDTRATTSLDGDRRPRIVVSFEGRKRVLPPWTSSFEIGEVLKLTYDKPTDPSLDYAAAFVKAKDARKVLVVFVDCPARPVSGAVVCRVRAGEWHDLSGETFRGVILCRPHDGAHLFARLGAGATDAQIIVSMLPVPVQWRRSGPGQQIKSIGRAPKS